MAELPQELIDGLASKEESLRRDALWQVTQLDPAASIPFWAKALSDPSRRIQEIAVEQLIGIRGRQTIQAVIPGLFSDDPPLRNEAIEILSAIGRDGTDLLMELLKDPDEDIHIYTCDILGAVKDPISIAALKQEAFSSNSNVRVAAVRALGHLGDPAALPTLITALQDDEWVRFAAVEAIAMLSTREAVKPLVEALSKSDELIGSMICDTLGALGDPEAVAPLMQRIRVTDPSEYGSILNALNQILGTEQLARTISEQNDAFYKEVLFASLKDSLTPVRWVAADVLAALAEPSAVLPIAHLAEGEEPDSEAAGRVLQAVVQIADAMAVCAVLAEVQDVTMFSILAQAVGKIGDPSASPFLRQIFADRQVEEQRILVQALAELKTPDTMDFYLSLLSHDDGHIRRSAADALGRLGDRQAVDPLFSLLLEDPYEDVKEQAFAALLAIGGPPVVTRFSNLAFGEEVFHRYVGTMGVGMLDAAGNIDTLRRALADPEAMVRKAALDMMARVRNLEVDESIGLVILDESKDVRLAAVSLFASLSHPAATESLIRALSDRDGWVRFQAAKALGQRDDTRAVGALFELIEQDPGPARIAAISAIGKLGGAGALPGLEPLCNHSDPDVAKAAEAAKQLLASR